MVGILLKKQLAEMYKSYFYDAKKGTLRSKGAVFLRFAGFALLIIGICGGIFGYLSYMLCEPLCALGLGWMYFVIMGLISIALGSFGSVFNTFAGLYLAKDNDLLLSMPIPVSAIMASRLLGVYLMGLMYSGMVSLGAVIVYLIVFGFCFGALVGGLFFVFFISIVVLILSCLLGWVVAKISVKLKNKSLISVIVSLVALGLYYFFYFKVQKLLPELIYNASMYGQQVKAHAFFLYGFGRMAEGSWLAILVCMAVAGVAFALTWLILERSFVPVVTGGSGSGIGGFRSAGFRAGGAASAGRGTGVKSQSVAERAAGEGSFDGRGRAAVLAGVKPKSVRGALLAREFARFKSSASYMLNCGLGTLVLVLLAGAMLVKSGYVKQVLEEMQVPGDALMVLGACAICLVAATNDMATPSVSLEGSRLWIVQSLPVRAWDVLRAKLGVQILLTAPFAALCVVALSFALGLSVVEFFVALAFVEGFVFFMALLDLLLGLKLPNLSWTNELTPIKQSLAVFLALFGGWACIGAVGGLYFVVARDLREMFGGSVGGSVGAFEGSAAGSAAGASVGSSLASVGSSLASAGAGAGASAGSASFLGESLGDVLYLAAFAVLLWVLCFVLAQWLKKRGSKVFERL